MSDEDVPEDAYQLQGNSLDTYFTNFAAFITWATSQKDSGTKGSLLAVRKQNLQEMTQLVERI